MILELMVKALGYKWDEKFQYKRRFQGLPET
jgi:hypothetical protein